MISFEQEVKDYFEQECISYDEHCDSMQRLDFGFGSRKNKRYFHFDVKEKRQQYSMENWNTEIPEEHLFILDDLAARKLLVYAPNSGVVIRDNLRSLYFFFSIVDLFLMPKQRVNRIIQRGTREMKGKWLIDLRNGAECPSLADVFRQIDSYLNDRKEIFTAILACYGSYQNETIEVQGTVRQPQHWQIDVSETR